MPGGNTLRAQSGPPEIESLRMVLKPGGYSAIGWLFILTLECPIRKGRWKGQNSEKKSSFQQKTDARKIKCAKWKLYQSFTKDGTHMTAASP